MAEITIAHAHNDIHLNLLSHTYGRHRDLGLFKYAYMCNCFNVHMSTIKLPSKKLKQTETYGFCFLALESNPKNNNASKITNYK